MAIDMSTVKNIVRNIPQPLYKRTFSFSNARIYYNNTETNCPIKVTVYSFATPTWSGSTASDFFTYLGSLGYRQYNSRYYLLVDNAFDFEYFTNNMAYVLSTFQVTSSDINAWFNHTGMTSTTSVNTFTITATAWTEVGTYNSFDIVYKNASSTSGTSYRSLTISKDLTTGNEYINNYIKSGLHYPNVTISSVSGNDYTLSDGETYTVTDRSVNLTSRKEIKMIQDSHGNILWKKAQELRTGSIILNFAASGSTYPIYKIVTSSSTSPYTSYIRLPSINSIKSQIETETGISASDFNSITSAYVTFSSRQATSTNSTYHVYMTTGSSSSSITSTLPGTVVSDVSVTGTPAYQENLYTTPNLKSYLSESSYSTLYLYKGIVTGSSKSNQRILSSAATNTYGYTFNASGSMAWTMIITYKYYV